MTSLNANSSLTGLRSASLPSGDFTVSWWTRKHTVESGSKCSITVRTSDNSWEGYTFENGVRFWCDAASNDVELGFFTDAPKEWWFICLVRSGSTVTGYYRRDSSSALTSFAAGSSSGALTEFRPFTWDGSVDNATDVELRAGRIHATALTSTQILAESRKSTPVVTSNLNAAYPWETSTSPGTDASANGYNITFSGTGTTGSTQPTFPDDSSGNSGSGAGSAGAATGSGTGTMKLSGTAAGGATEPTGAGSGGLKLSGTGAASAGAATGSGAAPGSVSGSGAGGVEPATASGSGTLRISGTGSGVAGTATGDGSSSSSVTGSGAGLIVAPSGSGSGILKISGTGAGGITAPYGTGRSVGYQTTSVNGNGKQSTGGFGIKRGNPSNTSSFFTGPSTFFVRLKVADWSFGSDTCAIQNIISVNYDGGGGDSHYGQFYNVVDGADAGKIRLYKGEGVAPFPVDPTLRSGAYNGWFLAGFRCLGGLTDPLEAFFIADDQADGAFQSISMNNAGGLRQIYVYGIQILPVTDEQSNQLHACSLLVSNRYWSDAEILANRFVDHPTLTGSHIHTFLPLRNVATAQTDESNLYGGAGGHDFDYGEVHLGITANDSPYGVAITGTGAGQVGGATGAGAGTMSLGGAGAADATAVTATGAGKLTLAGTEAGAAGEGVASGAGSLSMGGTGAGASGAATGSGSGSVSLPGAAAGSVSSSTAEGTGGLRLPGTVAGNVAPATGSGTHDGSVSGSAAGASPEPSASGTGTMRIAGSAASLVDSAASSGQGGLSLAGTAAGQGTPANMSGSGSLALGGQSAAIGSPADASATGTLTNPALSGSASANSPAPVASASGGMSISGTGAGVVARPIGTGLEFVPVRVAFGVVTISVNRTITAELAVA